MPIPDFREDGYLPEGVHQATEAEVLFRFGSPNRRRRTLALRLRRWLELARAVKAKRFIVAGSFVTANSQPKDLEAVVLLPTNFAWLLAGGEDAALEINGLARGHAFDFFAAEDDHDWEEWVAFFSQTREPDQRRRGIVEVLL